MANESCGTSIEASESRQDSLIHFTYGPMFSCKTHSLVIFVTNTSGERPIVFKVNPRLGQALAYDYEGLCMPIDKSSAVKELKSRSGLSCDCIEIGTFDVPWLDSKFQHAHNIVVVDEAQFLTSEQVMTMHFCSISYGMSFYCYGLNSDICGRAFPGSASLMAIAKLSQLTALCECGSNATMNGLKSDEPVKLTSQDCDLCYVDVDSAEYYPLCKSCWNVRMQTHLQGIMEQLGHMGARPAMHPETHEYSQSTTHGDSTPLFQARFKNPYY